MKNKPLVSVIIPVHNASAHLYNMLDSLVYQTLENIEIILIENSSTDNTLEIIEDFRARFPEKIICESIPPTNGPGPGRNRGFQLARADYIYHCDGDDIADFKALELMYQKAVEEDCDLVYGPAWNIANGEARKLGVLPGYPLKGELLVGGVPSLWTKLIHRSLIERVGNVPEGFVFEDVAYSLVVSSYAKKIGFVQRPVYYYLRHEDSEVNSPFSKKSIDTIKAERYVLDNGNPEYRAYLLKHVAVRININLKMRWYFMDLLVDWLKELWPEISENRLIQAKRGMFNRLEQYAMLSDTKIPKTLILAEFGGARQATFVEQMRKSAFNLDEALMIRLSEDNCDLTKAPYLVREAYQRGDYEAVGHYFALQYIYENGGIYVDSRLKFTASLNLVLPFEAFFGFADKENFTDKIFGAQKGDKIIKSLLETYSLENYCDMDFAPLARRIKNILVVEEDVALNGRTNLFQYSCALFSAEVFVVRAAIITGYRPALHVCEYPYTMGEEEDLVTIPRRTLIDLVNRASEGGGRTVQMLKKQVEAQKRKVNRLKNSRSWRITRPLRQAAHFVKRKRMN